MKIDMCCPKERGFNARRNTHKPQKYGEAGDVRRCHVVEELGGCRKQRERRERKIKERRNRERRLG